MIVRKAKRTFSTVYKMTQKLDWQVKGILLDITGVLVESGQGPIQGSITAIERLRDAKVPFRFVTNETQKTRSSLVASLKSHGFSLTESEVFSPGIATRMFLQQENLRPYLLIHPNLTLEFSDVEQSSPNCVVVGDAAEHFTYENMNRAFQLLLKSENPVLISMGKGKYYKEKGEIVLDLGGYTTALEFAANVEAKTIGKPSAEYFKSALESMGVSPSETVMVGDDIVSDVGSAQECGMKGVLVKTGKYREADMNHPHIKPDAIVENLSHFIDLLL